MKALTFIGRGRYERVTYVWQDQEGERKWTTRLFPEAVARIFEPEKVVVFVTSEVEQYRPPRGERCPQCRQILPAPTEERTYCDELKELLGGRVEFVRIPEGRSERELWEIFDRVVSVVNEGEAILLDITHAFRSIPMIVFAAAAYLRGARRVRVERIVYGAYEARDGGRAPIFDLTPLLDLLDWLSGTEFFIRRSDAMLLAERLRGVQRQAWLRRAEGRPSRLQPVSSKLEEFSRALHLARPLDVMRSAMDLSRMLEDAASEAERWAKPFATILRDVRREAEGFAYDRPDQLDRESLGRQLRLIEHLVSRGLWMQAVVLMREWFINWVILQRGGLHWLDRDVREGLADRVLNEVARRLRRGGEPEREETVNWEGLAKWFEGLPNCREIAQTWDSITQLRNDVAHCGMRKDAVSISSIEQRTKEILQRLKRLYSGI
jgi:CRISPR-associated Csx2 family protein